MEPTSEIPSGSFVRFVKPPLPEWAESFRKALMIIGAIFVIAGTVHILGYLAPKSQVNPFEGIVFPFMTSFVYLFCVIPYLISNMVYAIMWSIKLRNQKWYVSKGSTASLILAPTVVILTVAGILTFIYLPSSSL